MDPGTSVGTQGGRTRAIPLARGMNTLPIAARAPQGATTVLPLCCLMQKAVSSYTVFLICNSILHFLCVERSGSKEKACSGRQTSSASCMSMQKHVMRQQSHNWSALCMKKHSKIP